MNKPGEENGNVVPVPRKKRGRPPKKTQEEHSLSAAKKSSKPVVEIARPARKCKIVREQAAETAKILKGLRKKSEITVVNQEPLTMVRDNLSTEAPEDLKGEEAGDSRGRSKEDQSGDGGLLGGDRSGDGAQFSQASGEEENPLKLWPVLIDGKTVWVELDVKPFPEVK